MGSLKRGVAEADNVAAGARVDETGWLRIAEDGRVELDEAARRSLAGRNYTLFRSPGAVLVGLEATELAAGVPGAVVLAGDLARVAFPEVVSLVANARISGVLRVTTSAALRKVIFCDGEVRGATSDRIGERLGEVLIRMGLLDADQFEGLVHAASPGQRPGRLAVDRGLLSEHDLWKAVQEHVTTIFQGIVLESRGRFALSDEVVEEALKVPGLAAEPVLMEGIRRIDELGLLRVPERILDAYAAAFRDIFATAAQCGARDALRLAAASVFDEEPGCFRGVRIGSAGELSAADLLERAEAEAASRGGDPGEALREALSRGLLFLLFVAGEHLPAEVHQVLYARAKSTVDADVRSQRDASGTRAGPSISMAVSRKRSAAAVSRDSAE